MSTTDDNGSTESSSSATAEAAQWPDLPDYLLGMVRVRLTPWARVRLAAVCKAWRAATSRLPAPPAVPVLLLWSSDRPSGPKRLCGPDDAYVVRVPDKAEKMRFVGSHDGGWVAAAKPYTLVIVNLFSGAEVALSSICLDSLFRIRPDQVIFSEDPASNGCILACIANWRRDIALCRIGGDGSRWTVQYRVDDARTKTVHDIVFCNGELYGLLNPGEKLVKFKIDIKEDGTPVIASSQELAIQRRHGPTCEDDLSAYDCHIVKLDGKPAMAIQTRWLPEREPFFRVFTLVDTDNVEAYKYKWVEMTSFGDHALFLGPFLSKAVAVDENYGLERNHIYHTEHTGKRTIWLPNDAVYSVKIADRQHMYRKEGKSVGNGVERTGYYVTGNGNRGMWVYPPGL